MPRPIPTVEPSVPDSSDAVSIGWLGLMLPFVLVVAALLLFGTHSAGQIAMASILLAIPLTILALRRRALHGSPA